MKNATKLFNWFYIDLCGNVDYSMLSMSDIKSAIIDIQENYQDRIALCVVESNKYPDNDYVRGLSILGACLDICDASYSDLEYSEFFELLETCYDLYINPQEDKWLEFSQGEVRLIHEDDIDQIWTDSLIEQIKDCYDLSDLPSFICIDWENTAEQCKVDGMGHHFNYYDGGEEYSSPYYIFRTN